MNARLQNQFRQGDLLIERISKRIAGERIFVKRGRLILVHGEATGHSHEILKPQSVVLYELKKPPRVSGDLPDASAMTNLGLIVKRSTELVHQEHASIPLGKGIYIVRRQREYHPRFNENAAD